ncbi:hypothetical protein B0H14DRAFT_3713378 [Mycena olivaceomarginata]|nr:hypothetical protein B0H14DRAFT_3713378 [Mycena olivaceomarginata]
MPADVWDILEFTNDDSWPEDSLSIVSTRIILSGDWERPMFYRHRVKSFALDQEHFLEGLNFFDALSLSLPTQPIFPNLQQLRWMPQPHTAFPHIRLFLAPQIKELTLGSLESVAHLCILSNLATRYPFLTKLDIDTILVEASAPLLSALVKASGHLQSLAIPGLDDEAIVHASTLPGLRSFEFQRRDTPIPPLRSSRTSVPFPSLTHLTTPTMQDAIMILPSPVKRSLLCFRTDTIGSRNTAAFARGFYSTLARHCSHSSLQELFVNRDASFPTMLSTDQYHLYTVGGDILKPLLSFTNLVAVILDHPVGFDLDNSVIREMASAWPRIVHLYLTSASHGHLRSRVTLAGLYALAAHCPDLHYLAMTFDAIVVPKITMVKRTQRALGYLAVALSPITKPLRVANFMSAMFPTLVTISTLYDGLQHRVDSPQTINGVNVKKVAQPLEEGGEDPSFAS